MYISALLSIAPQTTPQAPPEATTDGSVFAQSLSEASERLADAQAVDLPAATVVATTEALQAEVAVANAPTLPAPLPTVTPETLPPVTTALAPAQATVQPPPQAPASSASDSTLSEMPIEEPLPEETNTENPVAEHDDPLQHIRQRMHLIDTAGTMDASASVAVLAYVPVATAVPVEAQATETTEPAVENMMVTTMPRTTVQQAEVDTTDETAGEAIDSNETPNDNAVSEVALQNDMAAGQPHDDDLHADSTAPSTDSSLSISSWSPSPSTTALQTSTHTNSATLHAAIGTPAWQSGLSDQVLGLHQRGEKQVDLQLHPADLGPLSISLKIESNGAQAQFITAHASVRTAVEQAIPQLREALASQGITLGEASVSDQPSRQQADHSRRDSQATAQVGDEPSETITDTAPGARPLSSLVDVYT